MTFAGDQNLPARHCDRSGYFKTLMPSPGGVSRHRQLLSCPWRRSEPPIQQRPCLPPQTALRSSLDAIMLPRSTSFLLFWAQVSAATMSLRSATHVVRKSTMRYRQEKEPLEHGQAKALDRTTRSPITFFFQSERSWGIKKQ